MTEYKTLKFKFHTSEVVTLQFDRSKEASGKYGVFWVYGVKYQGEDYSFIASFGLNEQLKQFKKNDTVEITKIDDGDKKSHFEVSMQGDSPITTPPKDTHERQDSPGWQEPPETKENDQKVAFKEARAHLSTMGVDIEAHPERLDDLRHLFLGILNGEFKNKN